MITRSLYLAVIWFSISLISTLIAGRRLRSSSPVLSVGWLTGLLFLGDAWALLTFGVPHEIALLTGLGFVFGLLCIRWMRHWNALGQVTWTTSILVLVLFILYAFEVTAFTPLNPLSFVLALIFFFIQSIALLMALTHTYESLDALCRVRWRRRLEHLEPRPDYQPFVSLHVPAYNEPPEVVENTLRSLAKLDYPNYEVLVVDNNTPKEADWRPLDKICESLGSKFRFMHLESWPGYKSGALNFALTQTDPRAEIIGTIDADYQVDPSFLSALVPAFADPQVAFIQTPQDYRDYRGDPYLESAYHGYKYFFEVSMPARNEYNAIIFAGTMGLIRKSVLQEIGGWDEWCITEDAEASLRILAKGYKSLYINRPFGQGLIPFIFEGLKRQRFRWCFGGIQILKRHWGRLMPWAHWVYPHSHLTLAQRYFYLVGGLQWFTDIFNLTFAAFLVLGGILSLFEGQITVRPLTTSLMLLPAVFLFMGLLRFVWVLRSTMRLSWIVAFRSMYNFFSLGWAVTLACIQGLIQAKGVFLRTPKSRSNVKILRALSVTRWETLIGLICLGAGVLAFVVHPNTMNLFLCGLLLWQSSLYLSAPYYSLLSVYGKPRRGRDELGKPVLENRAARFVLVIISLLILGAGIVQLMPKPERIPAYIRYLPIEVPLKRLFGIDIVPIDKRNLESPPGVTATPTVAFTAAATMTAPQPASLISSTPTASALMILSNPPSGLPGPIRGHKPHPKHPGHKKK